MVSKPIRNVKDIAGTTAVSRGHTIKVSIARSSLCPLAERQMLHPRGCDWGLPGTFHDRQSDRSTPVRTSDLIRFTQHITYFVLSLTASTMHLTSRTRQAANLSRACAIANAAITHLVDTHGVLKEPVGPGFIEDPKHADGPQFKGGV